MNCPKCKTIMVIRDGLYGDFWACPNSTVKNPHPTYSYYPEQEDFDYEEEMSIADFYGINAWGD